MSSTTKPTCSVIQPGDEYDGKQGLSYKAGIAAETVDSTGLCMAHAGDASRSPRQSSHAREPRDRHIRAEWLFRDVVLR